MKDYVGMKIDVKSTARGATIKGIVVAYEEKLVVSVVHACDKESMLICTTGNVSPVLDFVNEEEVFSTIDTMLENGLIIADEIPLPIIVHKEKGIRKIIQMESGPAKINDVCLLSR